MKTRRAYTIIELLMVVAVVSILLTLIFKGVSGSMVSARKRRAEVLFQTVQSGLAAYHAQHGEWPEPLGGYVNGNNFPYHKNTEGPDGQHDANMLVLDDDEVQKLVKKLVDEGKEGNPLLDLSSLFVSRDKGADDGKGFGLDFLSAIRGTSRSRKKMKTSEMYFGYPDPDTGYFRRFKMVYSIPSDTLKVVSQEGVSAWQ